jgi:LuxR family maltose regulon positive regulatory protein
LIEQLSQGAEGRLTLLEAPPGWGKTSLLAEWLSAEAGSRDFCWVSLDERDNDEVRFWSYVVASLSHCHEGLGKRSERALIAGASARDDALPSLINELAALERPLVLVFDDYHLISNSAIHDGVQFVIESLPARQHLVIATRMTPPLSLGRLRAAGELREVRSGALGFSVEEASQFVRGQIGSDVSESVIERLVERAEGWPAGIQLAALSMRESDDPEGFVREFAGDDRHVVDYLATEVLDRLDEELRDFLLATSILDQVSPELADALTQRTDGARMLHRVEEENLFIRALDARGHWYRYHRLFSELLRHELAYRAPERVEPLHQRAMDWHAAHGEITRAIEHGMLAGDVDGALALLAKHWLSFANEGRLGTVDAWLGQVPDEAIARNPGASFAAAWVARALGRLDDVEGWLALAEQGRSEGPLPMGSSSLASEAMGLRTLAHLFAGRVAAAHDAGTKAYEMEDDGDELGRGWASLGLGLVLSRLGRAPRALALLEDADRSLAARGLFAAQLMALGQIAMLHVDAGDRAGAWRAIRSAHAISDAHDLGEYPQLALAHVAEGRLRRAEGKPAREQLERGLSLARRGLGLLQIADALLALAEEAAFEGDHERAEASIEEARAIIDRCEDPGVVASQVTRARRDISAHAQPSAPRPARLRGELTERERAVLRLLDSELNQREMADMLYVSINTVKTHTRGIYRKLDVTSRPQAVEAARELGLI